MPDSLGSLNLLPIVLSKEQARAQFDAHTQRLGLVHTFSFDEVYDGLMERRREKERLQQFREQITQVEAKLSAAPGALGADPYPLEHSFADGLYIRQLTVPAETLTITKIHAIAHAWFLLRGQMAIFTEAGVKTFAAPAHGVTQAGTKRIIYHYTEVVFVTVHPTRETDLSLIEAELIAKDFAEFEEREAQAVHAFMERLTTQTKG